VLTFTVVGGGLDTVGGGLDVDTDPFTLRPSRFAVNGRNDPRGRG
jgi:hypothetical protein